MKESNFFSLLALMFASCFTLQESEAKDDTPHLPQDYGSRTTRVSIDFTIHLF